MGRHNKWSSPCRGAVFSAVLVSLRCVMPAAVQLPGTPMSQACRELPTVEECRAAAQVITDACLRGCVELQCTGIKVNCSDFIKKECQKRNEAGVTYLGYVWRPDTASCSKPVSEVNWCEEPVSRDCRAKAMVHELAHSCGWKHLQGLGVPGNEGELQCD